MATSGRVLTRAMLGAAGGLAATWVMTQYQSRASRWMKEYEHRQKEGHDTTIIQGHEQWENRRQKAEGDSGSSQESHYPHEESPEENSTTKVANRVVYLFTGHELRGGDRERAGQYVHYSMGAWLGAMFALMAPKAAWLRSGKGLTYGALAWLVNDDLLMPALHISKPPTQVEGKMHAFALSSHLVYGLSLYSLIGWMPFLRKKKKPLKLEQHPQRETQSQAPGKIKRGWMQIKKRPLMTASS